MSVAPQGLDLEQTLHERFGLRQFRAGQREVIDQVLKRRDVLCVMPTGGGKSLCYQLPALLLDGLTLVVSPLIALMKDQVDALTAHGIAATLINSTLDLAEQHARLSDVLAGRYRLVYVAPERFRSPRFVEAMARVKPALLAVDEAHCISEWGHDFRPDYARLGMARRALGMPPCIALTATATDLVRRDIADQLDLHDPAQFVTGFDRPNLFYRVTVARTDADKLSALAEILDENPGASVVYASSRKRCVEIGAFLEKDLRKSVAIYHAGLPREERTRAQDRFMSGEAEIVVATNAFGMGVDKSNIRSVVHFNMPGTLEAYYQEAGRAGRDGEPAECALLYAPGDRFLQELFIENEYPPPDVVFRVYEFLRGIEADPIELTQVEIREGARIELNESAVGTALKLLEGAGVLERFHPRENMAIVRFNIELEEPSLVSRVSAQAHVQRNVLLGLEAVVNRRMREPVYLNPDEFVSRLGIDRVAFSRAMKHLTAELPIDYVPPFRGNAIRVNDRKVRAREIVIDFAALEERKRQEYDKLERMIKYAQARTCRRTYLLGYFGDTNAGTCGQCDNCGRSSDGSAVPTCDVSSERGREVILKALSGVARSKGRFGKTVVAQMLTGSSAEKVARFGLTRLSTFGILSPAFKQSEVIQILDALAEAGFVENEEVDRFRPVINLTAVGWELLRGASYPIMLHVPRDLAAKLEPARASRADRNDEAAPRRDVRLSAEDSVSDARAEGPADASAVMRSPLDLPRPEEVSGGRQRMHDGDAPRAPDDDVVASGEDALTAKLKHLRAEWARELKQPPYCIFNNQTLDSIVQTRPKTPHDLGAIKGLGRARIERYGRAILDAVACESEATGALVDQALRPSDSRNDVPPAPEEHVLPILRRAESSPTPAAHTHVPTEEWTARVLERGFTIDEAAAIRGLERGIIIRHATWLVRKGRVLPRSSITDRQTAERWDAWCRAHPEHSDRPEDAAADHWALFLACRAQGSQQPA